MKIKSKKSPVKRRPIRRADFPILARKVNGRPLVYFDNAATSQKPLAVLKAVNDFYSLHDANVHRGLNPLAEEATDLYEAARDTVARFLNAAREEIIFTRGATEGVNLVARTWGEANLKKGDIVVLSQAEHHANLVPWLQLKEKIGIRLSYIPLRPNGELDLTAARRLLSQPRVKLLTLTRASNVLGLINPVKPLIAAARRRGIVTLIDAAQSIAHEPTDVRALGCDFLAFSGHKILGPTGIGVLYGRRSILEKMPPYQGGGDMIAAVHEDHFTCNELPYKFEAGTPPIAQAVGLAAALRYIGELGWPALIKIEKRLTAYFLKQLRELKFARLLGTGREKLPVFSLSLKNIHPHDAADLLGQEGIILRAGHHCAQPLHEACGLNATLRASLSFYNTTSEIDIFIKKLRALERAFK